MFNTNNLNEVCVQAMHIESKGENFADNYSKNPFKSDGNTFKGKWKGKHTITTKKEGENTSCSHYKKGHDVSRC